MILAGPVCALVTLAAGATASGARADATIGSLTLEPASGTDVSAVTLRTLSPDGGGGCPAGTAMVRATAARGGGTSAAPLVLISPEASGVSTSADFAVPSSRSFRDAATAAATQIAAGGYDLTLSCLADDGTTVLGEFAGPVWFTTATSYQSTEPTSGTASPSASASAPASGTPVPAGKTGLSPAVGSSLDGAVVLTPAATSPTLGTLSFIPASGIADQNISMTTHSTGAQKGCPAGDAQALSAIVTGPGNWAAGIPVVGFNTASLSTSSEMTVPWEDVFSSLAAVNAAPLQVGRYDVSLYCVNAAGSDYSGQFTGSIWLTTTKTWQSTDPNSSQTQTSTSLDSTPLYRVDLPGAATLIATVTPPSVAGTVQFTEEQSGGVVKVGSPVALANGRAMFTHSGIPFGMHYFHAEFVPGDADKATPSRSDRLIFVVGRPEPPGRGNPATLSGTARVGSTVTCSATFSAATTTSYAWLRDDAVIDSATAASYHLVAADAGHGIACRVSATNLGGTTTSTSSALKVGR